MYGAIQMLVRYERFGEILHEDFMLQSAKGLPSLSGKIPKNISKTPSYALETAYIGDILNFRTDTIYISKGLTFKRCSAVYTFSEIRLQHERSPDDGVRDRDQSPLATADHSQSGG